MSAGRIQCLLIASRSGHVIYERFYDSFSEVEKAEIRSAFDDTLEEDEIVDGQEQVGRFKNGRIVAIPSGEVVFYGLGTGEYNELAVSEVLRTLISVYKELHRVPALTDTVLLQSFPQTILVIDEVCKEGYPEHIDRASIFKALAFKVPTFTSGGTITAKEIEKLKTMSSNLMNKFSSSAAATKDIKS